LPLCGKRLFVHLHIGMKRFVLLNKLIKANQYRSYLEIGTAKHETFRRIACDIKVGVDISNKYSPTYHMSSDVFFQKPYQFKPKNFDLIFIDGLHLQDQVMRDILNSLAVLTPNGTIVCHDMNPATQKTQLPKHPKRRGSWHGDCWKAWVSLRRSRKDLQMFVVDADSGCGVIRRGCQTILSDNEELTWENFRKYRKEWLNLITIEEFLLRLRYSASFL